MIRLEEEMVCKVHVLGWGFVEKDLNAVWKKIRRVSLQGCLLVRISVFLRKSKRGPSALETVIFRFKQPQPRGAFRRQLLVASFDDFKSVCSIGHNKLSL